LLWAAAYCCWRFACILLEPRRQLLFGLKFLPAVCTCFSQLGQERLLPAERVAVPGKLRQQLLALLLLLVQRKAHHGGQVLPAVHLVRGHLHLPAGLGASLARLVMSTVENVNSSTAGNHK